MAAEAIRMDVLYTRQQQHKRATIYTLVKDMKWILAVLKVLGVVPIFKVVHEYKIALPQGHSFASLYTTLLRIFYFIGILLYMYIVFSPFANDIIFIYSKMDNMTIALQLFLGTLSCAIILWQSVQKSKNFILIINQLLGVDKELQQYAYAQKALENNCTLHERYMWLPLIHTVIVCIVEWRRMANCTSSVICVGLILFYLLLHAIINSYVIFVATLLHLLAVRFRYLNEFIKLYMTRHGAYNNANNFVLALKTFSAEMLLFYGEHNNLLAIFRKLNNFVHTTLLFFIAYFSYSITLSMYQFYLMMQMDDMNVRGIIWCIVFLCIHMPIAALLINYSDAATKEAKATSRAVARIYGRDAAQQKLIDRFLSKSIKQDIQFTAYGFFNIDKSTLFNMGSAITAYLVIIIQFKQLEEARAEASADAVYNKLT
ncbi:gustatory and pheromone receptor 32a [Bactrocera oleae]|uniref:gustatory and pheromone receptor 32a n=1 Tax=Bactrocera oleae TaxID=104688 RepID=UPI00387E9C5A